MVSEGRVLLRCVGIVLRLFVVLLHAVILARHHQSGVDHHRQVGLLLVLCLARRLCRVVDHAHLHCHLLHVTDAGSKAGTAVAHLLGGAAFLPVPAHNLTL